MTTVERQSYIEQNNQESTPWIHNIPDESFWANDLSFLSNLEKLHFLIQQLNQTM